MQKSGNTILITGGGTGIGRGLAEAFHAQGNQVIIAGRRQEPLDEVTTANSGMKSYTLDVTSPTDIVAFAQKVTQEVPSLNVVIHNSGIMRPEELTAEPVDVQTAEMTIATNLLGPIRLTAALLPHLKQQAAATIMTVSSGLAFTPLALTPTYCATKAAIHSWSMSLRHQLRDTSVEVLELAPPYVQTELMGKHQAEDPNAMPLADFIAEVMQIIESGPTHGEILVQRVMHLRNSESSGRFWDEFERLNSMSH
ncbi:SDR family oxidoreductase [Blastopirellula marina]|uniref:Oxidoreductase n=1 Tax=Blastopirellula marina TaxID=124 RepID=A0A2S8F6Y5_9BACT|nr:SDR family NAD(P)-dependent oxidoreductase [Blastopirellula marina]PQO27704.1 oxidoreductase [Blastopirellula marina]PTL41443.1 KR domain-containing protein [Blastopirellula marina]